VAGQAAPPQQHCPNVSVDPTAGIKNPKRKKEPGSQVWTEEERKVKFGRWRAIDDQSGNAAVFRIIVFYLLSPNAGLLLGRYFSRADIG
jgi:hypothetical protein